MNNRITSLFSIKYPIISGGMVWCSGHKLASAVTNAGGLGLIGAGSMHPETLREHIVKCKATVGEKTFGVNVPLFYPQLDEIIKIIIAENVPVVFTSGGNPNLCTKTLKDAGIIVAHVVASAKFAKKAEDAGVDAVVCEGFEAGGHNGRDELTTMVLVPIVKEVVSIPVIAAGGIATGQQWLACQVLGAEGVQIGSLFAVSTDSSAHENFKNLCVNSGEDATMLVLKQLGPARLIKNKFYNNVVELESQCAAKEQLIELLGKGRAKKGIFEGDLDQGELEIGQNVALINSIDSVSNIMQRLINQYNNAIEKLK